MGLGQITKNQIYLDLIEIFQFCLKIQHLWRLPHTFVSPKCPFYSSAVFSPQFFTEISPKPVSLPVEQVQDIVEQFLEVLFLQL